MCRAHSRGGPSRCLACLYPSTTPESRHDYDSPLFLSGEGTERLGNLPKFTQWLNGRARTPALLLCPWPPYSPVSPWSYYLSRNGTPQGTNM